MCLHYSNTTFTPTSSAPTVPNAEVFPTFGEAVTYTPVAKFTPISTLMLFAGCNANTHTGTSVLTGALDISCNLIYTICAPSLKQFIRSTLLALPTTCWGVCTSEVVQKLLPGNWANDAATLRTPPASTFNATFVLVPSCKP